MTPLHGAAQIVERHPVIEDALDVWAASLATEQAAYRGHVYRVYNYARYILASDRHDDALAAASAFHDIGIWSDGTFDYLAPSIARAEEYLRERQPAIGTSLVADMIANHHALFRIRSGASAGVVEAFRRADRADVSLGIVRSGVDRAFVRDLVTIFPYFGFHRFLVHTACSWFVRHPLHPLPMMRLFGAPRP